LWNSEKIGMKSKRKGSIKSKRKGRALTCNWRFVKWFTGSSTPLTWRIRENKVKCTLQITQSEMIVFIFIFRYIFPNILLFFSISVMCGCLCSVTRYFGGNSDHSWPIQRVSFYLFFGLAKNKRKRNHPGVTFTLLSDSRKMKRSPSNCLFELVKLNELTLSLYSFTPFSGWDWLFTKKEHLGQHGQEVLSNIYLYLFWFERQITTKDLMDFSFSYLFQTL